MNINNSDLTSGWIRACDSCCSVPCTVYCRADAAYLCAGCDAVVHAANQFASRHERVWVCEACECAPAELTCQADAAALCAICDANVHSANQLARRHRRVPILPLPSGCLPCSSGFSRRFLDLNDGVKEKRGEEVVDTIIDDEVSTWLLSDSKDDNQKDDGLLFSEDDVEYLNLVEYNSCHDRTQSDSKDDNQNDDQEQKKQQQQSQQLQIHSRKNEVDECVVAPAASERHQQENYGLMNTEYHEVSNAGFSFTHPLCHNVSMTSRDASIVPETTMADISNSHLTTSKGTIELYLSHSLQLSSQLIHADREAKVLRYREKRKMRKFEKKVRYASRKAYADTRVRIKGRFAKRSDRELEVDHIFASSELSEGSCGSWSIVPSF